MSFVLVTGANGFLGAEITRQLLASGSPVRATGRSQRTITSATDYRALDLTKQPQRLDSLVRGAQYVIHAAGLAHQFQRANAREEFFRVNAEAVEAVASAAAEAGVEHFVLVSSASVYGSGHALPPDENTSCQPASVYAESKYAGEQKLLSVCQRTGMRATILRMATLYGEGDPGNVGRLMHAIDRGRFLWIGDGENRKSLINRDDAARASRLAAFRRMGACAETYNVAPPPVRMLDVVTELTQALGRRPSQLRLPAWLARSLVTAIDAGPMQTSAARWREMLEKWLRDDVLDGSKFHRELGFDASVSLADGLRREVAWYRMEQNRKAA